MSGRISSLIRRRENGPRLLVSVRSADEAILAISGGADIIDVKEPSLGSLGMAAWDDIRTIADLPEIASGKIPFSIALGELSGGQISSVISPLPIDCFHAKMGLCQCGQKAGWKDDWLRSRSAYEESVRSRIRWVAVAYADADAAASPDLVAVTSAAIDTGCAGMLIDTWSKDQRTVLDCVSSPAMVSIAEDCHSAGLFLAVAGKLTTELLEVMAEVPVDIIAIRSAGCVGSDRRARLDRERITQFRQKLHRSFRSPTCLESL